MLLIRLLIYTVVQNRELVVAMSHAGRELCALHVVALNLCEENR